MPVVHQMIATGEVVIRSPSPGTPSISSIHRLFKDWPGSTSSSTVGTWFEEEEILHIIVLEMMAVQLPLNVFHHWIMRESIVLMSDSGIIYKEAGRRSFLSNVWSSTGYSQHCRAILGLSHNKVHPGREHTNRSVRLFGSGSSNWVFASSSAVQHHVQGVQSSCYGSYVITSSFCKLQTWSLHLTVHLRHPLLWIPQGLFMSSCLWAKRGMGIGAPPDPLDVKGDWESVNFSYTSLQHHYRGRSQVTARS